MRNIALEIFKLFGSIFVNNDEANKSIAKTDEKAEGLATKFVNGAKTAAKWGGAVVTAAGTAGTFFAKKASDFEGAFAQVNTLLSGNSEEITEYKDKLKRASTETGVSLDEMSSSVYNAISAGVSQGEAINFVTNALKLAKGGFTDTTTAVDIMTTALNAYGLSSDEATRITDVLISTQNLGKTTVSDLASSMGKVIPVASAYGINIENLGAAYATLTAGGIATSEATTYMKAMFTELAKDGSKVSDVLTQKTSKSFSQLMEEGKSLGDIVQILSDSVDGDATAFSGLWSSVTAGTGALAIMNKGSDSFNDVLESMENSTGATQTAFDIMEDTLEDKVGKVKNTLQNIETSVGESLIPPITMITDFILQNMPMIENTISSLIPTLTTLFELLLPPLMDLAQQIFPILIDLVNTLIPPLSEIISAILPVIADLLSMLLPPIIEIVQMLLPLLIKLIEPLMPLLQPIIQLLQPIIDLLLMIIEPLVKLLDLILPSLIRIISWLTDVLLKNLQPAFQLIANLLGNVVGTAFKLIMQYVNTVITIFKNLIGFITNIFSGNWAGAWENIKNIFGACWDWIKSIFTSIKDVFLSVIDFVVGSFKNSWNTIKNIFSPAADFFKGIWKGIKNAFGSVGNWFKDTFSKAWQAVKNVFSTGGKIFDGIKDGIVNVFKTVVNAIIKGINKVISIPFNAINNVLQKIHDISILGVKPFTWIKTFNVPQIPLLAKGGVVKKPTAAVVGEDGEEAIVPLKNNTEWINAVAGKLNSANSGESKKIISLLEMILSTLQRLDKGLYDKICDAITNGTEFQIDDRNFARLVKKYV